MAKATVGHGFRTPGKHRVMDLCLSQEVGALSVIAAKYRKRRSPWYDLTAGSGIAVNYDGVELPDSELNQWEKGCSVGILTGNAMKSHIDVVIRASEKAPNTFDVLANVLSERLPEYGLQQCSNPTAASSTFAWIGHNKFGANVIFEVTHGSGQDAYAGDISNSDAVFALNDPNSMAELAMSEEFTAAVSTAKFVRMLHTMGCNVGGIKRLDRELRSHWFDFITAQRVALHRHHDLILGAIERDASQWAYMLRTASRWRQSNSDQMRKAFDRFGMTLAVHSYRDNPRQFYDLRNQLFLTQRELEEDQ